MRKITLQVASTILLWSSINGYSVASDALRSIDIAIGNWPPVIDKNIPEYGETTEVVKVILERIGYRANFLFMPWGQAENKVAQNETDNGVRITYPYIETASRTEAFIFSKQPIFRACMRFFYHRQKISTKPTTLSSLQELNQYRLGYVEASSGFQYPDSINAVLKKQGTGFNSQYDLFAALVDPHNTKVEVVPSASIVGEQMLYDLFPTDRGDIAQMKDDQHDGECMLPVNYFLLASRKNPNNMEFMRKFDAAHAQLDGEVMARIKLRAKERPSKRQPLVIISSSANRALTNMQLPSGTLGKLLEWSDHDNAQSEALVYLLNGPYRGITITVPGEAIRLK